LIGLSSTQIGALRATPSLANGVALVSRHGQLLARIDATMKLMSPEQRSAFETSRSAAEATAAAKQAQAQIDEVRLRISSLGPLEDPLSLEKSWHILHYLFTGHLDSSIAPGDALLTGQDLGEDMGYGPPRLHDEAATRAFAGFLSGLDLARLDARVNYREMLSLGIYSMPGGGRESDGEYESALRGEVALYFPLLREYVARMSDKNHGILIWLS
jgi:hypothetical protein